MSMLSLRNCLPISYTLSNPPTTCMPETHHVRDTSCRGVMMSAMCCWVLLNGLTWCSRSIVFLCKAITVW